MKLRDLLSQKMTRNTLHLLGGQGGKVVLQGAYFAIVARALGVDGFGAFAAVVALVALTAPFGSLGAQQLMVRHIVRDPGSEGRQFATALTLTLIAGTLMGGVLVVVSPLVAPPETAWWVIVFLACADLLGARIVDLAGSVWVAREEMRRTASYQVELNTVRVVGALVLWASPVAFSLESWSLVYLVTSLGVTATVVWRVFRRFGGGVPHLRQWIGEWRDGLLFSFSLASQTVYNDIDKAMLGRMSSLEATGIYTAAYRVVDMAYTPLRSLLGAAYPKFFREGAHGLRPALQVAKRIAVPGVGYSIAAAALMLVAAPLVPIILGEEYAGTVDVIRLLALIPVIRIVHYLAADALTGSGHQGWRSVVQITIAALNAGLNLWLIPALGLWGAVIASLVTDALLATLLWIVVGAILKSHSAGGGPQPLRHGGN